MKSSTRRCARPAGSGRRTRSVAPSTGCATDVSLFVTDTHALVWYAQGQARRLGKQARRAFEYAESVRSVIYVPALVMVELLEQSRAGRLRLNMPPADWIDSLLRL